MQKSFYPSSHTEIQGLIDNGRFLKILEVDVPSGTRNFGSRFVDELKRAYIGLLFKIRLLAQNYAEEDGAGALVATKAPKVQ